MKQQELTNRVLAATSCIMQGKQSGKRGQSRSACRAQAAIGAMLLGGAVSISGCVSVNAPDKPIVIELNINIKQEVIYRLSADAGNTIDKNPDIF